jgi:hypothetical protein
MRQDEYEERRRALERLYQEDLELIRTAHDARLRALETLWRDSPEAAAPTDPVPSVGGDPDREQRRDETPKPVEPGAVRNMPSADLKQAIQDVLPQLPEIFTRHDVEAALGFAPPRSSIVRILQDMWAKDELTIEESSEGRHRTKYRKRTEPA